jgi:GNAT superfamily N-acetyltransferase
MASRFRIRQATASDLDALAEVRAQGWAQSYRGLVPDVEVDRVLSDAARAAFAAYLATLLDAGTYLWLAVDVEDGHRAVALAVASASDDREAPTPLELVQLYLLDVAKGSGLADALLGTAIGDAPAFLWTLSGNERAIAFYRRHGFELDGGVRHEVPGASEVRLVRGL